MIYYTRVLLFASILLLSSCSPQAHHHHKTATSGTAFTATCPNISQQAQNQAVEYALLQNSDAYYIAKMRQITQAWYRSQPQTLTQHTQAQAQQLFVQFAQRINRANEAFIKQTRCITARAYPAQYLKQTAEFFLNNMSITQKVRQAAIHSASEFTSHTQPVILNPQERTLLGSTPASSINQWQAINLRNLNGTLTPKQRLDFSKFQLTRNKSCNSYCVKKAATQVEQSTPSAIKQTLGAQYASIIEEYAVKLKTVSNNKTRQTNT